MRRGRLAAIVAVAAAFAIAFPMPATAESLPELEGRLEEAEADLAAKESECGRLQSALGAAAVDAYKGGQAAVPVLAAGDVGSMLAAMRYGNAMVGGMAGRVERAEAARHEAEEARDRVASLLEERRRREGWEAHADASHFRQTDPRWAYLPYWGGNVASHGCGLCSFASAIDVLTGRDLTPADVLRERGDWMGTEQTPESTAGGGGETHAEQAMRLYGIRTESVSMDGDRMAELDARLDAGDVVLVCASGTAFRRPDGGWRWSGGHYVLVYRRDGDGYRVQDPTWESGEGAAMPYSRADMERLAGHAYTMTAYGR